ATLAEALKAEQDAYQRRLDVCLKLRQIAARANDDRLTEQADDLERRATALYHARTAKFGVRAALRATPDVDVKAAAAVTVAPPTVRPLPRPPPPAVYVTPGEVTEANHAEKVRRLLDEMEADRKALEAMPRASEVSVIR